MPKFNVGNRITFDTTVAGIPCLCVVLGYQPYRAAAYSGSMCGPEERASVDWILLDRREYRAGWLEAKLSDYDIERIDEEAIEACE